MIYLNQTLHTYFFYLCPVTGMQNSNEALPSIILAGRGLLVKMLITLPGFEPLCDYMTASDTTRPPHMVY